jgi:hypothetical protein
MKWANAFIADAGTSGRLGRCRSPWSGRRGCRARTRPALLSGCSQGVLQRQLLSGRQRKHRHGSRQFNAETDTEVVQSGSGTISLFAINPSHPSDIELISVVGSGGDFPISVDFNKAGDKLCVLNGGEVNGVKCFSVSSQTGLTSIPHTMRSMELNQTTPPVGPAGTASQVLFSDDGSHLLASVKGSPMVPGFLAVWDVSAQGALSQNYRKIAGPGGATPFGMNLIPGIDAVLVADPAVGFDIFDIALANASADAHNVSGQSANCWTSHSAKLGSFYLTDAAKSIVTEVNMDKDYKPKVVQVSIIAEKKECPSNAQCSNTNKRTTQSPWIRRSPQSGTPSEFIADRAFQVLNHIDPVAFCTSSARMRRRFR